MTTYTYDENDNETSVTYPDGSTESWTYQMGTVDEHEYNQVLSHTDQLGHVTTYTYDDFGNEMTQTQVIGLPDATSGEHNDIVVTSDVTPRRQRRRLPGGLVTRDHRSARPCHRVHLLR